MKRKLLRAKAFDVYGQAAMILLPILCCLRDDDAIDYLPIFLGAWQLISFFAHRKMGPRMWMKPGRGAYGIALLAVLIFAILAAGSGEILFAYIGVALMAGPVLGLWYLIISVAELRELEARQNRFFI